MGLPNNPSNRQEQISPLQAAGKRTKRPKPASIMAQTTEGRCPRSYDHKSPCQWLLPTSLSSLNQDVLLHISTFLFVDDLSCLSRTSRRMYEILAREMLKRPVELWPQDIYSYLRFLRHMRREKRLPTRWDININIEDGSLHKSIRGEWLVKILGSAKGLTGLTLAGGFDTVLNAQEFRSVLSSLPRLQRLTIGAPWGDSLHDYLASLQGLLPKLRILELKYKPELLHLTQRERTSWEISLGPQLALLEALEIHTLCLAHDNVQLPQLRKLVAACLVIGARALSWGGFLSISLPNLEHLAVQQIITQIPPEEYTSPGGVVHFGQSFPPDDAWLSPISGLAQLDLHPLPLKYLRVGSLLDLLQFGVPCVRPLARIDIGTLQPGAHPRTVESAFIPMSPRCITFHVTPGEVQGVRESLEALLGRVDRMAYLTHMAFNTSILVLRKFNIETLAAELGRVLRESFVTHLFVRLFEASRREILDLQEEGEKPDVLVARAYDDTVKAQQVLVADIPSLRSVCFEVGHYGLRGWLRDGETNSQQSGQWTELDEPDIERMLKKEDLHCSHLEHTLDSCFGAPFSWAMDE
ncbi:hypothetical protein ONZ51_g7232 [Trametes cubensis]|uniref:F-box domain-containing protein n=1 Tax=Trametes cubensis TaxID=1111947 RepID=A0AAD7XC02_9APHY|nr:hypothetical protein ONZ51_g7232 [Trametes cubensis]